MRDRIADAHRNPSSWHVKHRRGGLIDIEFIAQYVQLREAARRPEILHENTAAALRTAAETGALDPAVVEDLLGALRLWHGIQQILKLTVVEDPFDQEVASPSLKTLIARTAGAVDFEGLKAKMAETAARAFAHYQAIVAQPAEAARARRKREGA
jgi:[glutamine synthetase] adenylyltransferase / [glutamine synthetase]-adenylyl-L-tyrosine phosphorylase